jgi:hypothetical protein
VRANLVGELLEQRVLHHRRVAVPVVDGAHGAARIAGIHRLELEIARETQEVRVGLVRADPGVEIAARRLFDRIHPPRHDSAEFGRCWDRQS